MTHRSENLQASLFEAERPCVELRAAQKSELATVIAYSRDGDQPVQAIVITDSR